MGRVKRKRPVTAAVWGASDTTTPVATSVNSRTEGEKGLVVSKSAKISRRKKHRSKAIGRFHDLNKLIEQKKVEVGTKQSGKAVDELRALQAEFQELGGIEVYQSLSKSGEKRTQFNTSRWLIKELRKAGLGASIEIDSSAQEGKMTKKKTKTKRKANHEEKDKNKMALLDVGALGLNYKKEAKWIDCRAIDLNSESGSGIEQADFFELEIQPASLDIVVLSLVINYVGDPIMRGLMLEKGCEILKPGGYLYIVLPLACVSNSRYFSAGLLVEMMKELDMEIIAQDETTRLSFHLFQKQDKQEGTKATSDTNGAGTSSNSSDSDGDSDGSDQGQSRTTGKRRKNGQVEASKSKKQKKKLADTKRQKHFMKRLIRQGATRNNFHIIL